MKKIIFLVVSTLVLFISCIKNDIPFPYIFGEIIYFEIEGQEGLSLISAEEQVVEVTMPFGTDLSKLKIDSISVTKDATYSPSKEVLNDFTNEVEITVSTYQDYLWKVRVLNGDMQLVINSFEIEGQVSSTIDTANNIIQVIMPVNTNLDDLSITTFEYSPSAASISPAIEDVKDFSEDVVFLFNEEEEWIVKVYEEGQIIEIHSFEIENQISSTINISTNNIDVIMPNGTDISNLNILSFDYSPASASINPSPDSVTDFSEDVTFQFNESINWTIHVSVDSTPIEGDQIPFSDFSTWFQEGTGTKSFYLPGNALDTQWRSGDKGAADLIFKTYPQTVTPYPNKENPEYALLETKTAVGVIAAGSLFVGHIQGSGLTDIAIDFGIPFTDRPLSFTTMYQYMPKTYDDGIVDECDMYVILQVREGDKRYRLATAWHRSDRNMVDFESITLPFVYGNSNELASYMMPSTNNEEMPEEGFYNNLSAQPTHIIVVFASSAHGASYKGGVGSKLSVKGLELNY
ncbi:PCMD domain-containing protein [Flammeovirga kamogawensis]|uniref:PCMD domain-containing protein n=1 Tax=Flammeovirga kamogawensis TaxID=373891 RepID=A0ABX8H1W5_9BACT|nr:PCMD domain-containing protein [Flammeovirga kamogawensis]MBB6462642.1 hypothetical protein [Flammeovirga kamogawensis]QWG09614.1 PCMD domain-containing protein [Flammeovirga kamogawensis]TRX65128.1 hypothetical protein EO216_21610 [Flammeovirga kamogawensis]